MRAKSRRAPPLNLGGQKREDLIGILHLLHSASVAVQMHGIDRVCSEILASCTSQIKDTYAIPIAEFPVSSSSTQPSFAALLRMLDYLRVEIRATLKDNLLCERLDWCIAHLTARRKSSRGEIYAGYVMTSH